MTWLKSFWAFLLGLTAGSFLLLEFALVPLWKPSDSWTAQQMEAFLGVLRVVHPFLMGLLLGCAAIGLGFLLWELRKATRLVPDPLSQPWKSVIPSFSLLVTLLLSLYFLNPRRESTFAIPLIPQTPVIAVISWLQWNGIRVLLTLLAFFIALKSALNSSSSRR